MAEWFITDSDCMQCCREIPGENAKFELMQINSYPDPQHGEPFYQVAHGTIDVLSDYTPEEIENILGFYGYENLDDFVMQTAPIQDFVFKADGTVDRENSPGFVDCFIEYQLIAEMIFETEIQEYVEAEYSSWDNAAIYIAGVTGLSIDELLENKGLNTTIKNQERKPSLDDQIKAAHEKNGGNRPKREIVPER